MSELSSRLLCVAYGLSIVSVTYIYKYLVKSIVFKKKAKLEDGRTSVDEMTMKEELTYYLKKEQLKLKTKSLIAIAVTFILTIITFTFYCKGSLLDSLKKNGFNNSIIDETCNIMLTILLNSTLFGVVIYKSYSLNTLLNCNQIQFQKSKGQFGLILEIFKNISYTKQVIIVNLLKIKYFLETTLILQTKAPFVEEWVFKVLFSIILGRSNNFNIQWFSPLVFSLCHFLLIFFYKNKHGWIRALIKACKIIISQKQISKIFQFKVSLSVMTFVFGIYSSFIFINTNSFLCSFLLHGYCNFLGPPKISSKSDIALNLVCLISFFVLMNYVPFILE